MIIRDLVLGDAELLEAFLGPADMNMLSPPKEGMGFQIAKFYLQPNCLMSLAESGGAIIGEAHIRFNAGDTTAELGYGTSTRHCMKGVATNLAQEVVRRARMRRPAVEVWAKVGERNPASIRVLEKLCFERVATAAPELFEGKLREGDRFYRLPAPPISPS